jgi:hypothetical protein
LVKDNFERPGIKVTYHDVITAIATHPVTKKCNLRDYDTPDLKKFEALKVFAKHKKEGTAAFSNISLISNESFISSLLYVRNHIHHVGQGKKEFTKDEIEDIENIISVFFELNPIEDKSISEKFKYKVTTSLKEYSPDEIKLLQKLKESLDTAKARLNGWIADLESKYGSIIKSQGKPLSLGPRGTKTWINGIKIKIACQGSDTYGLSEYGDVFTRLPNDIVLNVGSRGFTVDKLKQIGFQFDQSGSCSLAVEGIDYYIS